jgi:peptidoglycan-associated lipoprotein
MRTVSYGKEVPLCTEASEDCWARNRRAHFAVTGKVRR